MNQKVRVLVSSTAKVFAVVALTTILFFYFPGYSIYGFLLLIVPLLAAVALTSTERRQAREWLGASADSLFFGAPLLTVFVLRLLLFGGVEDRTLDMIWQETDTDEVVLAFRDSPGNIISFLSNEWSRELARQGSHDVRVSFELSKDLNCVKSFELRRLNGVRINVTSLRVGRRNGFGDPWGNPPWCWGPK